VGYTGSTCICEHIYHIGTVKNNYAETVAYLVEVSVSYIVE